MTLSFTKKLNSLPAGRRTVGTLADISQGLHTEKPSLASHVGILAHCFLIKYNLPSQNLYQILSIFSVRILIKYYLQCQNLYQILSSMSESFSNTIFNVRNERKVVRLLTSQGSWMWAPSTRSLPPHPRWTLEKTCFYKIINLACFLTFLMHHNF